jgi:hypothetical protein
LKESAGLSIFFGTIRRARPLLGCIPRKTGPKMDAQLFLSGIGALILAVGVIYAMTTTKRVRYPDDRTRTADKVRKSRK